MFTRTQFLATLQPLTLKLAPLVHLHAPLCTCIHTAKIPNKEEIDKTRGKFVGDSNIIMKQAARTSTGVIAFLD